MEGKSNKGLTWLIVILILLFIGLVSLVVFNTMLKQNDKDNNITSLTTTPLKTTETQQRTKITDVEKEQIEKFINNFDNYALSMFDYSEPKNILREDDNTLIGNPADYLSYSIRSYNSAQLSEQEIDLISDDEGFFGETYSTTGNIINDYFKEKTNQLFDKEIVKKAFLQYYFDEIDKYVFYMTDTLFGEKLYVKDGYKEKNKYYISLTNKTKLVILINNDQYYFYSCKINNQDN